MVLSCERSPRRSPTPALADFEIIELNDFHNNFIIQKVSYVDIISNENTSIQI